MGLDGPPELFSDSLSAGGSSSQSLAKFVPYQLDPISYDSMQSMFSKRAASSHAIGGSVISRNRWAGGLDEDESTGGGAGASVSEHSRGRRDAQLPRILKGRGPTHESILQTPYVSPEVMRIIDNSVDGRRSRSGGESKNASYIGQVRPHTSSVSSRPQSSAEAPVALRPQRSKGDALLSGYSRMSRTAPLGAAAPAARLKQGGGGYGGGRPQAHEDPLGGSYYSAFSYNPSANYADMTSSLAMLDPLCLNLSVGLHHIDGAVQVNQLVGGMDTDGENELLRPHAEGEDDGARESAASKAAKSEPMFDVFSVYGGSTEAVHAAIERGDGKLSNLGPAASSSSSSAVYRDSRAASAVAEALEPFGAAAAPAESKPHLLPKMASEFLIHTEFMKHLFVDGATVQQTQDLIFKMQV